MLGSYRNLLINASYEIQFIGTGPWTATGYTAPAWRLVRTSTPTVSARLSTLDNTTSTEKWLRGRPCIQLDVSAITRPTQDVEITQYVSGAHRFAQTAIRLWVPLYGPTGATVRTAILQGSVMAGPTHTMLGIGGGTIVTGTAQAGSGTTITLASGASATDSEYDDRWIELTGGAGVGQMRPIASGTYVGATKIFTPAIAWATAPDGTTTYKIANAPSPVFAQVNTIADDPIQEYITVQTFGQPSAVGTYLVGPADFQALNTPWEKSLPQFFGAAVEAMRLRERYHAVGSGQQGVSSTVSLFFGVDFPTPMRATPSFVLVKNHTSGVVNSVAAVAGTSTASTGAITGATSALTARGGRLALQNGWAGLTNNQIILLGTDDVGYFTADYFA